MTPEDPSSPRETDSTPAPPRGIRSSLLALGSAAVLAVYAAGYVRTKPAAERFESAESGRRRPLANPMVTHEAATASVAPVAPFVTVVQPARPKPAVHHETTVKAAIPAPAPAADSGTTPPVSVAVVPAAPPAVPVAAPANTAPAATPKPDTAVAATDSLHRGLKDGRYRSWGYSQHGNIEAEVEIQGGRIVNASITQCLTAYSCSYVRRLQTQVVERQSPEVDTVSGATQSSDAFYGAVFSALAKAT